MVPGLESAGLVSPIIARAVFTTSNPCQTYQTAKQVQLPQPATHQGPDQAFYSLQPAVTPEVTQRASQSRICPEESSKKDVGKLMYFQVKAYLSSQKGFWLALTMATTGPELMYFTR